MTGGGYADTAHLPRGSVQGNRFVVPVPPGFGTSFVVADGDFLDRVAALGITPTNKGLISFWFAPSAAAGGVRILSNETDQNWINVEGSGNHISIGAANGISVRSFSPSASSDVVNIRGNGPLILNVYSHVIATWDGGTGAYKIYIDGVDAHVAGGLVAAANAEWGGGAPTSIAAARDTGAPVAKLDGCLAHLWFDERNYLDLDVPVNLKKFRTATGHPASVGADGSLPFGTVPRIYMADGKTNTGSGGAFVVNGTPGTCGTAP